MKGFAKAIKRTPHNITTRVGMSKKSTDPTFDDYQRQFHILENSVDKLIKDTKVFIEHVVALFTAGQGFATHFAAIFQPIGGEYNLGGGHPNTASTMRNVNPYQNVMEELRSAIGPELELIESRIIGPAKELQSVMKLIRKSITKREHKLVDYDRFNNSLTKLRDKKEKSLSDEKNLFKLEQDFEISSSEYDYINNAMKTELPQFMALATQFIDPLFHSFFFMQLNIFYLMLEKLNGYAEGKYDVTNVPGAQIEQDYESNRTDAWETIEALSITHRIISTSKLVQANRSLGGGAPSTLGRASSSASSATSSTVGSGFKKAPPPPTLSKSVSSASARAAPPPYSAGSSTASAAASLAATKRAPPPPPPLKPKPKVEPPVQYVVALYDFAAQADGDLEFSTGDRIEVIERTTSAEDWWTGRLNGRQGVFPGNYVQEA